MSDTSRIESVESEEFRSELTALLNKHSIDTALDMPDFILSALIQENLSNLMVAHDARLAWQGRDRWKP